MTKFGIFFLNMLHFLYPTGVQKGCILKKAEKPDKTTYEML